LVQKKIDLEDFKLQEYFPLKLFEILEEKQQKKLISYNMILCQTKYFKRLLDQTYSMRKNQSKMNLEESFANLPLSADKIERLINDMAEMIDHNVKNLIDVKEAKFPIQGKEN